MKEEMTIKELLDKVFKDPATKYELAEFDSPATDYATALQLITKPGTGKQTGKNIYCLKTLAPFHSDKEEVQVYVDEGKASPEEIIRQLWVYKLINYYGYDRAEIALEKPITFGTDTGTKFADIIVYTNKEKTTPKIVLEIKKPKRKDGIEQLRSYLNAEGSPIGVWSNGSDKVILYRPYPQDFDSLPEIPKKGQFPEDLQDAQLTLAHLDKSFDFKKILLDLEELVLGSSGVDSVFNEIFKIIFAKIWDEKEALNNRRNQEVEFKWFKDPELTYERINHLFKMASSEWSGVFNPNDKIELQREHLNVCIAPLERKRFLGSNLRIMDDAFEYLLPSEAKKKQGQFFTPRFVIDMCVRMLNPKRTEYVIDPACGSAGFLVHAMEWAFPAHTPDELELRKSKYAARYLWGVDFDSKAAKTSRALMLIAGDGHSNIFGPEVDTLNPVTWYRSPSGRDLLASLKKYRLTEPPIPNEELLTDEDKAWTLFNNLQFDIILSNPPFAGEVKNKTQLAHYQLAKPALKRAKDKQAKEERDVLFIERILKMLKPGGRAAIVLPQGKFNNSSLAFIREWILRKARLLAVVGLHGNTFKPHTGTKTSVLFIQKYTEQELQEIERVQNEVKASCPNYATQIEEILSNHENEIEVPEDAIPENIIELLLEEFTEPEPAEEEVENNDATDNDEPETAQPDLEELLEAAETKIHELQTQMVRAKQQLEGLKDEEEALKETQKREIEIITEEWEGSKAELREHLKPIKEEHKQKQKGLKETQKETAKRLKALIKQLESDIPQAEYDKNLLTTKGKLQLILNDDDLLQRLSDRFIASEVAQRLDYSIFMAVSEYGGKNNSGEYEYLLDEDGNIMEDTNGNPVFNQDLVNYDISKAALEALTVTPAPQVQEDEVPLAADPEVEYVIQGKSLAIAEAFVKHAKEQNFDFWT